MDKKIKEYLSKIGKKGGESTSDAKKEATRKTLAEARKKRWQPKPEEGK